MNLVNRYRGTRTPVMEEYARGGSRRWWIVTIAGLLVLATGYAVTQRLLAPQGAAAAVSQHAR